MKKNDALKVIADKIAQCQLCTELYNYRTENNYQTVPGIGSPNADIFVLGEAPGQQEAENGEPFIGRAGKLLTKILETAGWSRESIFIANVIKCRPPQNRDPSQEEATNCRKFLDLQIQCVSPKWILCFGKVATKQLLGITDDVSMGSLRGVHSYKDYKVLATYHPSYLLRQPSAKEEVWKDLQPVIEDVNNVEVC